MLRLLKTVRLRVIQPLASNKTQIHPYVTLGAASRTIRAKLAHTQDPRVALAHDSKITSAFSTQPQWLRNILCADHTRADVHHLSKTHLTWDIDGWPTPVKSRIYFNRDGKPWSTVNTRDARSPFGYFEDANKDTSALFDDAKPHRCVFAYKHSCANLDGNWDYLDDFDVAYCFLTRDTQILQDELDRIAEAAGEEVSDSSVPAMGIELAIAIESRSTDNLTDRVATDRETPRQIQNLRVALRQHLYRFQPP